MFDIADFKKNFELFRREVERVSVVIDSELNDHSFNWKTVERWSIDEAVVTFYARDASALSGKECLSTYTIPVYLFNLPDEQIRVLVRSDSIVQKDRVASEFVDDVPV